MKKWAAMLMAAMMTVMVAVSSFPASAASATAAVSASAKTVKVGDTVKITVTCTSSTNVASMDAAMRYDAAMFDYVSTSTVQANGSAGVLTFSYFTTAAPTGKSLSFTVTFKAKKTGSGAFSFQSTELSDWDFNDLGTPSGSVSVSVQNPSLSGNANLSALHVSSGSLSPAFSPNVTSYQIVIPYSVTTLTVSATTADKNAKMEVTGSRNMKVGKNTRVVKVTAPNGTVKSYTLNITRQENTGAATSPSGPSGSTAPADKEDAARVSVGEETRFIADTLDKVELPAGYEQVPLTINDTVFPSVQNRTRAIVLLYLLDENKENGAFFEYHAEDMTFAEFHYTTIAAGVFAFMTPDASLQLPASVTQTFIEIDGQTITAWAFPEEQMADYFLVYALSPAGNTGLYCYDRLEGTFQRYSEKLTAAQDVSVPPDDTPPQTGFFAKVKNIVSGWAERLGTGRLIVIAVGAPLLLAAVIVTIVLLAKRPRSYRH